VVLVAAREPPAASCVASLQPQRIRAAMAILADVIAGGRFEARAR